MNKLDKAQGALVGLAVGDAIGTTLEFKDRDTQPVLTDMVGGGVFQLNPGEWTDDTSMALCMAQSLVKLEGFYPDHIMSLFHDWYTKGYMSSTGSCFDIGVQTAQALRKWNVDRSTVNNDDVNCGGNGSIMRLAPVVIFGSTDEAYTGDYLNLLELICESSLLTHAHETPVHACIGLGVVLNRAINGFNKESILDFWSQEPRSFGITDPKITSVLQGSYITKTRNKIRSGGYCVHTLEAALWCFYHTSTFKDAVLLAANLGDDADTVAAVTGQIAGAYYGLTEIPQEFSTKITMSDEIISLAEHLYKLSPNGVQ